MSEFIRHLSPHPGPLLVWRGEGEDFVGRFPRVALTLCEQPWANFFYAFSVFEFAQIRVKTFTAFSGPELSIVQIRVERGHFHGSITLQPMRSNGAVVARDNAMTA